jgi:G3E family GTPase
VTRKVSHWETEWGRVSNGDAVSKSNEPTEMATNDPVPVTLLTGFLGSGKTTLLNRMLQNPGDQKLAVVVNEFGDVGIDGSLVVGAEDDLVELRSGCICCTIRGDLHQTVLDLLKRRERKIFGRVQFDRLVIEASGMAAPGPILQTFLLDDALAPHTRPDGVIAMAHATHIADQVHTHPEAEEQLGSADLVVLNHCDQAENTQPAIDAIRAIQPAVPIFQTVHAKVDIGQLFDLRTTDPTRWEMGCDHPQDHVHTHTTSVRSISLQVEAPVDLDKLKIWLQHISGRRTHQIIRIKGIVACRGLSSPVVVQGIYQWLELGPGQMALPARSTLVLIGRDMDPDELRRGWAAVCR